MKSRHASENPSDTSGFGQIRINELFRKVPTSGSQTIYGDEPKDASETTSDNKNIHLPETTTIEHGTILGKRKHCSGDSGVHDDDSSD